jgi:hypothetical protein
MFSQQSPIGIVMVSGLGRNTPSMFSSTAFHSMGPSYALGATGADWYQRAKQAEANFQALLVRTQKIANKTVREEIADWIGAVGSVDTPMERYGTVIANTTKAESYTPLNTVEFERSQLQNRVTKLESYNSELQSKVKNAEDYYGILPEPVIIEKLVNVPGASSAAGTDWTVPIAVGVGTLVLVGIISFIKG